MSFKVVVKGKDKLFKDIQTALNDTIKITVLKDLGRIARDIIYKRTKSGKGVDTDTSPEPSLVGLQKLSDNYIKTRSKLAKKGFTLGKFGSIRKSNLTLTGQMLDAIEIEARRNGFTLKISDNVRTDGVHTNKQIATFVSDKGRPFFALAKNEQLILFRNLETKLRGELRKVLGSR